jgi:hypothetical protein
MTCVHTYRYLETGIPFAWVGTSDSRSKNLAASPKGKDRSKDFFDMHDDNDLTIHRSLGDLRNYTHPLMFYETYLSAIPTTSYKELNRNRLLILLADAKGRFFSQNRSSDFFEILEYLGIGVAELDQTIRKRKRDQFIDRNKERFIRYSKVVTDLVNLNIRTQNSSWSRSLQSSSYKEYPNILAANCWAKSMFDEFIALK